jgi:type IV secretory pathway VirB9-like protein
MNNKLLLALAATLLHAATAIAAPAKQPTAPVDSNQPTLRDPYGPIPSPHDSRNVSFIYEPGKIYTILAQAAQFVHLELAPNERIVTIQMSDTNRWQVRRVETGSVSSRVFIKPIMDNLSVSATIVTNTGRSYELIIKTTPEGAYRYQHVSWRYPDLEEQQLLAQQEVIKADNKEQKRLSEMELSEPFAFKDLNWDYEVKGNASFKPEAIFDNGKFTYIRLPQSSKNWPAVFMTENSKRLLVIDWLPQGQFIVVQRLVDGLLLKLDDQDVEIWRRGKKPRTFFSWGD